LKEIFLLIFK